MGSRYADGMIERPEAWKERQRGYHFKHKYGITAEQYDAMLESQNFHCAICPNEPTEQRRLAVDHDHATGKVRALLCHTCNNHLGVFETRHADFTAYLEKHRG